MIIYEINCGKYDFHNGYGINAIENGLLLKSVSDITNAKTDIVKIVNMCNELNLELCHLDDVIEDYLTDFCI